MTENPIEFLLLTLSRSLDSWLILWQFSMYFLNFCFVCQYLKWDVFCIRIKRLQAKLESACYNLTLCQAKMPKLERNLLLSFYLFIIIFLYCANLLSIYLSFIFREIDTQKFQIEALVSQVKPKFIYPFLSTFSLSTNSNTMREDWIFHT